MRWRLLSAALRLADACDAGYDRVPESSLVKGSEIPVHKKEESIKHHQKNKAIWEVNIIHGSKGEIKLSMEFKAKFGPDAKEKAHESLEEEIESVKQVFKNCGFKINF